MLQDVSMKEVEEGYVIISTRTMRVAGEAALDDKADVVLMAPVESLLALVPLRLQLPYAGLRDQRLPEKGDELRETGKSQSSSPTSSAL